jgi:hypothetical protein
MRREGSIRLAAPSRLTAVLRGGLGNQLFQYAMARSLAIRFGISLQVDSVSEFILDREYRRRFALEWVKPRILHATRTDLVRWLAIRSLRKGARIAGLRHNGLDFVASARILDECAAEDVASASAPVSERWWIYGYWQSYLHFEQHSEQIAKELTPPVPIQPAFLRAADHLHGHDSVAVGLRLYEEARKPEFHARDRQLRSAAAVGEVVRILRQEYPGSRFVFFCTHKPADFQQLSLPDDAIIATPENGFGCATGALWLMTQCRHHVFSNSTLYWWGAWLSQWRHAGAEQHIYAADSFKNPNAIPSNWRKF